LQKREEHVPPIAVQHEILVKHEATHPRIARERETARETARRIEADFEA